MEESMGLQTREFVDRAELKGVAYPRGVRFDQILITGPPGSGKSALLRELGGWPMEGFIDLSRKGWWHDPVLAYRPREVHLGLPFVGTKPALAICAGAGQPVDWARIRIPPERTGLFGRDWRRRLVFDFQLPPPEAIYRARAERLRAGSHPADQDLTRQGVEREWEIYAEVAKFLHRHDLQVLVRLNYGGMVMGVDLPPAADRPEKANLVGEIWAGFR